MKDQDLKVRNATEEELEIDAAFDSAKAAKFWDRQMVIAAWLMYFVAVIVWTITTFDSATPLFLIAFVLFLARVPFSFIEARRNRKATRLLWAYKRKKALPAYDQIREAFRDMPHLHIHLADDGVIHIHDRSNK